MIDEIKIEIENLEFQRELFGEFDHNIKLIEEKIEVQIFLRDGYLFVKGEKEKLIIANKVLNRAYELFKKNKFIDSQLIRYILDTVIDSKKNEKLEKEDEILILTSKGKPILAKTRGQRLYVNSIKDKDIVFGIGPAGTGKTYLAVAMAAKSFRNEEVSRIILTRPAVEAGESLGFLPGDMKEKVDPYLRPLYDALFEIIGAEKFQKFMERGLIEVAPLAFMRGRTLDNAFIILDEAQNTTAQQMKMFLTRMGLGSKMVITGDLTQIDIAKNKESGLRNAQKVLKDVEDVAFCIFTQKDVVRHQLVQKIINAYELYGKKNIKK